MITFVGGVVKNWSLITGKEDTKCEKVGGNRRGRGFRNTISSFSNPPFPIINDQFLNMTMLSSVYEKQS